MSKVTINNGRQHTYVPLKDLFISRVNELNQAINEGDNDLFEALLRQIGRRNELTYNWININAFHYTYLLRTPARYKPNDIDEMFRDAYSEVFRDNNPDSRRVREVSGNETCTLSDHGLNRFYAEVQYLNEMAKNNALRKALRKAEEDSKAQMEALKEAETNRNVDDDELIVSTISKMRTEYEASFNKDDVSSQEMAQIVNEAHNKLVETTSELQRHFNTSIDDVLQEMMEIKADFSTEIHRAQQSLYQHEFKPIARHYVDLYRMCHVDKIIGNEINRIESAGGNEEVLNQLVRLSNNLERLLRSCERAMKPFGLYPFYPQVGAVFDEYREVISNEIDYEEVDLSRYHMIVKQVILPGVIRSHNSEEREDEVILPAEVLIDLKR